MHLRELASPLNLHILQLLPVYLHFRYRQRPHRFHIERIGGASCHCRCYDDFDNPRREIDDANECLDHDDTWPLLLLRFRSGETDDANLYENLGKLALNKVK